MKDPLFLCVVSLNFHVNYDISGILRDSFLAEVWHHEYPRSKYELIRFWNHMYMLQDSRICPVVDTSGQGSAPYLVKTIVETR